MKTTPITRVSIAKFAGRECDPADFTRGLLRYLRAHKELLEEPEHARLYEEALDFQLRFLAENYEWDAADAEGNRKLLEFIVDVQNDQGDERPPIPTDETVAAYLEHRRKIWGELKIES